LASGEKKETIYSSYYRPLPKICLVGVEKITEEECSEDDLACIADKANSTSVKDTVVDDTPPVEFAGD